MAKARKILGRKTAIKNIHSVTRTMEMVATARFRKVHTLHAAAGPYIAGLESLLKDILARTKRSKLKHPLLREPRYTGRRVLIVITSNRGLCGGYNGAILHAGMDRYEELKADGVEVILTVSGKRGIRQMRHRGYEMDETTTDFDGTAVPWRRTAEMADRYLGEYLSGELGGVDIAFAEPVGAGSYRAVIRQLLPLTETFGDDQKKPAEPDTQHADSDDSVDYDEDEQAETDDKSKQADTPKHRLKPATKSEDRWAPWEPLEPLEPVEPLEKPEPFEPFEPPVPPDAWEALPPPEMEYEFVPSVELLLKRLLPNLVRLRLFNTFMEAAVTEQQARIASMRSASENAEDMIRDLNIKYNRTRQAQITTELAEILGGRAALE